MAKPAKKPMNAGEWFARGDKFHSAANALEIFDKQNGLDHAAPYITLNSFAAECYLKSLLRLRENPALEGEHHLGKLYSELTREDQEAIREAWDPVMIPYLTTIRQHQKNLGSLASICVPSSMRQMLKLNGLAFVEWRYRKKMQGSYFLGPFPQIVRGRIQEIRPDWIENTPDDSYDPNAQF